MSRPIGQRTPNGYRAQVVDPVTKRRRNITARTPGELQQRVEVVKQVRGGLKYGLMSVQEGLRAMRPAIGIGLTVADVWARYRKGVRLPSQRATDAAWENMIAPVEIDGSALAEKLACDLSESVMRQWCARLEVTKHVKGRYYAPKTIELAFASLQTAYNQAVAARLLSEVPWGTWKPRLGDVITNPREAARSFEELLPLLEVARQRDLRAWRRGTYSDRFFRIMFLVYTGVRQAEAAGLAWDMVDIDEEPHQLRVTYQAPEFWWVRTPGERPKVPPKGKRRRTHAMHPSVVQVLRYQRAQLQKYRMYRIDGPVFPGKGGRWRRDGCVIRPEAFREMCRDAGFENLRAWVPHSLRHSTATITALQSGGDLQFVRGVTGHADLKTVMGYVASGSRKQPVALLPALPAHLLGGASEDVLTVGEGDEHASGRRALPATEEEPADVEDVATFEEFREKKGRKKMTFAELAAQWVRDGRPGVRPKGVTEATKRAYSRAYNAARMNGKTNDDAREAGFAAKRAALGAWGKALKQYEARR